MVKWSSIFESVNTFNSQALAVESATLQYWASGSTVWQNNNGESSVMLNESTVDNQAGPISIDPIGLMYVSFNNSINHLLTPSVFSNSSATGTLTPLTSLSGQALLGAANGVAVQSISYNGSSLASVAAYGNNLFTSADFSGVSSLAYVLLGYGSATTPVASSNWTPISGISGAINSVAFASALTTY